MKRPDKKHQCISLTAGHLKKIRAEKRRTQVGSIALLKTVDDKPADLKPGLIDGWLSGGIKTAKLSHYDFVLRAYRALPDSCPNAKRPVKDAPDRLTVTDIMRKRLRFIHTNAPANYLNEAPGDFTTVMMAHLLSGRAKTIPIDVWHFMEGTREERSTTVDSMGQIMPDLRAKDIPPAPRPRKGASVYKLRQYPGTHYVEITDTLYNQLHQELHRTRVSHKRLLNSRNDVPKGLRELTVANWFLGKIYSAEKDYLDFILKCYAALPDAP
jgi:hypothetical protein